MGKVIDSNPLIGIALLVISINFILAILFSRTSIEKGHYGIVTGLFVMITGIPGMLYAIALQKNKEVVTPKSKRYVISTIVMLMIYLSEIGGSIFVINKLVDNTNKAIEDFSNKIEENKVSEEKIKNNIYDDILPDYSDITYDDIIGSISNSEE